MSRNKWHHGRHRSGVFSGLTVMVLVCLVCATASARADVPPGYHAATEAYKQYAQRDYHAAARSAAQAVNASPDNLSWRMLLVNSRALSGDLPGARDAFAPVSTQQLEPEQLMEGAYAAQRLGYKSLASDWFKQRIDAADRGESALDEQTRYNVRQTVSDLDRRFGFVSALSYGQVGVMNPDYLQTGASRETLQTSAEVWWRPRRLNQAYGKHLEFYARANETLYDGTGGAVGSKTVQTVAGVRVKPFEKQNTVFALERLFRTGGYSRNDWLVRAAWSAGEGAGTRIDRSDWRYWNLYAEADYYLKQPQLLGVVEGRYGHRYRLDTLAPQFTIAPFIGAAASYDSKVHKRGALGVGPGINIRTAFREDRYHSPQSVVDLTLQYRVRVAGDDRARGFFATLVFSW